MALQTFPILLLGPYGGVVADRVDKRKLMMVLQMCMGLQAAALAVLALLHIATYLDVCELAVVLGLNCAFRTNPATRFGRIRPLVSVQSGHPFRSFRPLPSSGFEALT